MVKIARRKTMNSEVAKNTSEVQKEWKPKIFAFVCNWCTYAGADLAGTSRFQYSADIRIIRHTCTGRIDPLFLIKAFEKGADGIIVSGCHPADCHYNEGNYHARRRWTIFRSLLKFMGIEMDRVYFSWVSAAEGNKWAKLANEVSDSIRKQGPYKGYKTLNKKSHGE